MIRFSASLVVVGLGLLVAGGITSKLVLIYVSIAICAVALLFLIIGAIVNRAELLGREPDGIASRPTETGGYAGEQDKQPEPAATTVGAGATAGASRGLARENAEAPGNGTTATRPDRPREASSPREAQAAGPDFAGYERFAGDADVPNQWRALIKEGDEEVEGEEKDVEVYVFLVPDSLERGEWDFEHFRKERMPLWTRNDYE